jgi:hypothetical protein
VQLACFGSFSGKEKKVNVGILDTMSGIGSLYFWLSTLNYYFCFWKDMIEVIITSSYLKMLGG